MIKRFGETMESRALDPELSRIDNLWIEGKHKNLIRVLRQGFLPDRSFYYIDMCLYDYNLEEFINKTGRALEYLGWSDANECQRCRLSVAQILDLFPQIAQGVQFLHQNGIIYQNLTPRNGIIKSMNL